MYICWRLTFEAFADMTQLWVGALMEPLEERKAHRLNGYVVRAGRAAERNPERLFRLIKTKTQLRQFCPCTTEAWRDSQAARSATAGQLRCRRSPIAAARKPDFDHKSTALCGFLALLCMPFGQKLLTSALHPQELRLLNLRNPWP